MKPQHFPDETLAAVAGLCKAGRVTLDAGAQSRSRRGQLHRYAHPSRRSASHQNASKHDHFTLIWFDCGSCRYAFGAAATIQGTLPRGAFTRIESDSAPFSEFRPLTSTSTFPLVL
jgi:hypothetical protein